MSRSINEIQDVMLGAVSQADQLDTLKVLTDAEETQLANELTSNSKVSIWRLFTWVVAFGQWVCEKLWETLRNDIELRIAATRPFTKRWYTLTALKYQHGYDLPETGIYPVPNTAAETQAVNASKIVKKASVVQTIIQGVGSLRVKVAKVSNGILEPLNSIELAGFQEYIDLMTAAGVFVVATSTQADDLKTHYKIYYNGLVLDNEGRRLDGNSDTPAQDAIKAFLSSSEFDGLMDLSKLENALQAVEGIESIDEVEVASKYAGFAYDTENVSNAGIIDNFRQPDSGYFTLDEAESVFEFIEYPYE